MLIVAIEGTGIAGAVTATATALRDARSARICKRADSR